MRIIAIAIILTLSSCMVSQKAFDEKCKSIEDKCCKLEEEVKGLKSKADGMEMKEQLLREQIHKMQNDTIVDKEGKQ